MLYCANPTQGPGPSPVHSASRDLTWACSVVQPGLRCQALLWSVQVSMFMPGVGRASWTVGIRHSGSPRLSTGGTE